jgi:hypothetical protein
MNAAFVFPFKRRFGLAGILVARIEMRPRL